MAEFTQYRMARTEADLDVDGKFSQSQALDLAAEFFAGESIDPTYTGAIPEVGQTVQGMVEAYQSGNRKRIGGPDLHMGVWVRASTFIIEEN